MLKITLSNDLKKNFELQHLKTKNTKTFVCETMNDLSQPALTRKHKKVVLDSF